MKGTIFLLIGIIAVIFSFSSCDELVYNPHLENNVQIDTPKVYMRIDLNNAPDTLFINAACDFKYTINTGGKRFCNLRILIDGQLAAETTDTSFYHLTLEKFSNGYHNLTFETWAFSGSGSLADAFGSEFLVASRKWTVYIDKSTDSYARYLSIRPKDGRLEISWEKNKFEGFLRYEVLRSSDPENSSTYRSVGIITDRNKTNWTDSLFIGGKVGYKVNAVAQYKAWYYQGQFSDAGAYLYPVEKDSQGRHILKWRKCRYYANLKKYVVQRSYINNNYKDVFTSYSASDTSAVLSTDFGAKAVYKVFYSSGGEFPDLVTDISSAFAGNPIAEYPLRNLVSVDYIPQSNSIYFDNGVYRFDASTIKLLAEGKYPSTCSRNGKFAFTHSIGMASNPIVFPYISQIDPLTLQSSTSYLLERTLGHNLSNEYFGVTGTGYVFSMGHKYSSITAYPPEKIIFFDFSKPEVFYVDSVDITYRRGFKISDQSDEGEYIILWNGYLYNLRNKTVSKIGPVETGEVFFLRSGKEYGILNNRTISIYKCSNNSLQRSFTIQDNISKVVVDPATGYLGGNVVGGMKYRIYDLNSGSLKKEIGLVYDMGSWSYPGCYLANSMLFSTEGCYMKIEY